MEATLSPSSWLMEGGGRSSVISRFETRDSRLEIWST